MVGLIVDCVASIPVVVVLIVISIVLIADGVALVVDVVVVLAVVLVMVADDVALAIVEVSINSVASNVVVKSEAKVQGSCSAVIQRQAFSLK